MHSINLFGDISRGYDFFGGSPSVSAEYVSEQLAMAEGGPVELLVNSDGGDVFEGQAIMILIRLHSGETTSRVIGIAASVASMLILAADRVEMAPGSQLMIHNPYTTVQGDAAELRKFADTLDHVRDSTVVPAYRDKTGLTTAEIVARLDEETWLDTDEAIAKGFVDGLAVSPTKPVAALLRAGRYAGAPSGLVAMQPKQYRAELERQQTLIRQIPLNLLRETVTRAFSAAGDKP